MYANYIDIFMELSILVKYIMVNLDSLISNLSVFRQNTPFVLGE